MKPKLHIDAEGYVLGAILLDSRAFDDVAVADVLAAEDFAVAAHRTVFAAITAMMSESQVVNAVSLADKLRSRGQLGTALPGQYGQEHAHTQNS